MYIDWLLPRIEKSRKAESAFNRIANELGRMEVFPDANSPRAPRDYTVRAQKASHALKEYLEREKAKYEDAKSRAQMRQQAAERRAEELSHNRKLQELKEQLEKLSQMLGKASAGYAFERWFYDLADLFGVEHRRPFKKDGRQIDGSVTVDGMSYLVSLKFEDKQCVPIHISDHRDKVNGVHDYTMGLVVAISGFTDVAIEQAGRPKSNLLLWDHSHIYAILGKHASFQDMLVASKIAASEGRGALHKIGSTLK